MKKLMNPSALLAVGAMAFGVMLSAQAPGGGGGRGGGRGRGPAGPVLSVTSDAFPDGGVIPMHNAGVGDNKSPAFEFHWSMGTTPAEAPADLKSYVVILHDIENAGRGKTTTDTLHWSAFNIPGDAKGLPEGSLPAGSVNGPGIRGGPQGAYFGPGAGPGPYHHYVFEFYALDTTLDLSGMPTRDDLMKAMDGHVIGKAAYVGRFHRE